jgi:hypothetical protein
MMRVLHKDLEKAGSACFGREDAQGAGVRMRRRISRGSWAHERTLLENTRIAPQIKG